MNTVENKGCTCYTYRCPSWRMGVSVAPCGMCTDCSRAEAARAACPLHPVHKLDEVVALMIQCARPKQLAFFRGSFTITMPRH